MTDPESHPPGSLEDLPGLAYRSYFLLMMVLVSASVVAEHYMMVVLVEPVRRELHLSDTSIAMVKDLAIAVVYILAVIPLGHFADRSSKRKIVAVAAVIWSGAVLICGTASNFWMLLVGRAGIGLGEGAFTPPSQSWIADLFPMRQRGTVLSIFLLGASLGTFAGPALGGYWAHEFGWRTALLLASIPGFVLAPLVWFTLRDVRPGLADGVPAAKGASAPMFRTLRELMAIRTLPLLIMAAGLNTLLTMGLISWAPAFMERSHGVPAQTAGLQLGGALFIGSIIGHTMGGPLSDVLGRRDLRWYVWMMMFSGVAATGVDWLILTGPGNLAFPLFGVSLLLGGMSAAPLMAVVTGLAPARSRATAVAVLMVTIQVVGFGLGPVFVGWLSDVLHPLYGEESLGMAMRWVLLVSVPSTILGWLASRSCLKDFAGAGGWGGAPIKPAPAY